MIRFEDVVNKEFLEKYLPEIRPEFHAVEDGRVNYGNLEDVFFSMDGENKPNRFIYVLVHGIDSQIPSWNLPAKFRGNEEGIYKYCLCNEITWQDIFGNPTDENVLL